MVYLKFIKMILFVNSHDDFSLSLLKCFYLLTHDT